MQHQSGVAAEQAGGINPQRRIDADAGVAIAVDRLFGVALDPGRLHCILRMILSETRCPSPIGAEDMLFGIMRVPVFTYRRASACPTSRAWVGRHRRSPSRRLPASAAELSVPAAAGRPQCRSG